jgi:hypothetical protein
VTFETPNGIESYGILIAPSRDLWRARIITFPNVLWLVPGGGSTVKFAAGRPEEAERQAIAFIEDHCERKRYLRRDQMVPLDAGALNPESAPGGKPRAAGIPRDPTPTRKLRHLPVRFGTDRATMLGSTADVSEEGMFVVTPVPLETGVSVLLHLELEGTTVPLRGLVMWNRVRREPGRPVGMGIRLVSPPAVYIRYVQALK